MILKKIPTLSKMDACASELHSLGPDTEPEFLNIGNLLGKLADICFGMTDDALALSSLSNFRDEGGSEEGSIIEEDKKLFDEVSNHVKKTIDSLNDGEHLLVDLLSQIKKLREPIQKLYTTGKTFRVLGISIKVESSRTADESHGFLLLAEEVAEISTSVQSNCQYCTAKTDVVEKDIHSSKLILHHENNSYDESGEQAIFKILSALDDIGSRSETLAARIKDRSAVMVQGLSDVVMAMQFHDITRQQLENVAHALVEISEKVKETHDEESGETEPSDEQIALETYGILSIQVAHLNSIYEQVINARKQIETGLDMTMDQAQAQATDARSLLEMEGKGRNTSVVTSLENEIDNIVVSLNKSLAVLPQAALVSRDVYNNISEIGEFVHKIEGIAFDVKVLAINAMVEAIKTGDTGNALIVLAKELSDLSQETRDGATNSINTLEIIKEGTKKQLEFSETLDRDRDKVDGMIKRAKELTETILSSLQEVSLLAKKMDSSNRDLASRITRLLPGIKFPKIMGDRIDKNWTMICQIIDQIEAAYPQFLEENSAVEQMMKKLTKQYVMDRERSIHAQVAGIDLDDDSDQGRQTPDGEFEDNIELF